MDSKTQKRVILFSLLLFIFTAFFLLGCSESTSKNTFQKLSSNMQAIESAMELVEVIDTSSLIVEDFMSVEHIGIEEENIYSDNEPLNEYFIKIKILNNAIAETAQTNNTLNYAKMNLISKSRQVKSMCDQLNVNKIKLSDENVGTIDEINSEISSYLTRIKLTKNEVKNNLKDIDNIKSSYGSNTNKLTSRYKKLQGSLNTRLTYYDNISVALDNILEIFDQNEIIHNGTNPIIATQAEAQDKETKNQRIKKNIDTYENAGRKYNEFYNNNPYNEYGNGYGTYGMGGYGGYGYGMPYGFGYGYPYPNINTYRGIKNIDTYKKRRFEPRDYYYKYYGENGDDNEEDVENIKDPIIYENKQTGPLKNNQYGIEKRDFDEMHVFPKNNNQIYKAPNKSKQKNETQSAEDCSDVIYEKDGIIITYHSIKPNSDDEDTFVSRHQ